MSGRARHAWWIALALLAASPARGAEPAAVLRNADGFRLAVPPYAYRFPADHASHPQYQIEWWYYTGHLAAGARRFGFEMTFFRVGLPATLERRSAWASRDLVFLHLALTDERGRRFLTHDASHRAALGIAGADSTRYRVWLDGSEAWLEPDGRTQRLVGRAPEFGLDLTLVPAKPPVIHGHGGVSQKTPGEGNASHYYSLTRLDVTGTLALGDDSLAVLGQAWMDHEFASNRLSATHRGWDWFSVQLDDGRELMLYQLRRADGSVEPLSHGTWVERDGSTRPLASEAFRVIPTGSWTSPRTKARYPMGWRLEVPGEALALTLTPTLPDQELVANTMGGIVYWEGSVRVHGTLRGAPVAGVGYTELTGYTGRAPY